MVIKLVNVSIVFYNSVNYYFVVLVSWYGMVLKGDVFLIKVFLWIDNLGIFYVRKLNYINVFFVF